MGSALARKHVAVARPLKVLIPLIRADIEAGDRAGMEYYADAGDKLIEAKESEQVPFGSWTNWISKNFGVGERQAQRYMHLARLRAEQQKRPGRSVLPISLNEMRGETERQRKQRARAASYESILREVEPDTYAIEKQTRADEVQLHRDIALELIDIGYKALATHLHPDHGGSKEAMGRLNRVRAELKGVAETRRFV